MKALDSYEMRIKSKSKGLRIQNETTVYVDLTYKNYSISFKSFGRSEGVSRIGVMDCGGNVRSKKAGAIKSVSKRHKQQS
jgi:hypothetical protein